MAGIAAIIARGPARRGEMRWGRGGGAPSSETSAWLSCGGLILGGIGMIVAELWRHAPAPLNYAFAIPFVAHIAGAVYDGIQNHRREDEA